VAKPPGKHLSWSRSAGLGFAKQALFCLSHGSSPFYFSYFSDWVLPVANVRPHPIATSFVGITGLNHHTQLVTEMGSVSLFTGADLEAGFFHSAS
jgi:hypothetical protein